MKQSVREIPTLIAFAGSLGRSSYNRMLAEAAAQVAEEAGAKITRLDLGEYAIPLYDPNLEADSGIPEPVQRLKRLFARHDGFLVASPEYNGSISPLLKNTIDWMSRQGEDRAPMLPFRGKIAALLSASPGRLGGMRGLIEVRRVLSGIGVVVVPSQCAIPLAGEAFHATGQLISQSTRSSLERTVRQLVEIAGRLR